MISPLQKNLASPERSKDRKNKVPPSKLARPGPNRSRSRAPGLRSFAQLLLQALDIVAQLGHAARDRHFIDQKHGPDRHPGGKQKFENFS